MKLEAMVKKARGIIKGMSTRKLMLIIMLSSMLIAEDGMTCTVPAGVTITDKGEDISSLVPVNEISNQYGIYYTSGDVLKTDLNLGGDGTIEFSDLKRVVDVYDELTPNYTYSMDSSVLNNSNLNEKEKKLYEKIYNMNNDEMYLNFRSEDGQRDFVDVALDEIGTEYDDGTKYGVWYSKIIQNGYNYKKEPWCAMFVSYVAKKAGIDSKIIYPYAYVPSGANKFKEEAAKGNGTWHNSEEGYRPKRGDIFLTYLGSNSHTGIVLGSNDEGVYTIEGNTRADDGTYSGGCVNTRFRSYAYIEGGYYSPNISLNENGLAKSENNSTQMSLKM